FLTGEPLSLAGAGLWFADGGDWELQGRSGALGAVALPRPGGGAGVTQLGESTLLARFAVADVGGASREGLLVVQRPNGVDEAEASFLLLFSLQIAATYRARALHGALALAIADKDDLIAELSTPVIHVWRDTVCVPVIGSIEAERAAQMTGALLDAVTSHGLRHVIVDFTGIATMDTQTVRHFTNLARAIGLLGASCAFTGISAPVAQVLVSIGVDLGEITALPSVKAALAGLIGAAAAKGGGQRRGR
ncbi:MAG: STAS domain-containing protein, partial [Myxococcales bacterium]|nr:STAS domain-containing protein [Myxococcales bacterium]